MTILALSEDDRAELVQVFAVEAEEMLDYIEELLVKLEQSSEDEELLNEIFRAAHTLKGNAGCLQFDDLTAAANEMEELLESVRSGAIQATPVRVSQLLDDVDRLRALVARALSGRNENDDNESIAFHETGRTRTLRIGINKLDRMLNLVGEIAVARSHVRQLVEERSSESKALDALRELDRLSFDLQEMVMNARMVPLGPTLTHFHRVVRDLSASLGKRVNLVLKGHDVEVDTTVIETLKDPITHMIRNAMDHGIEIPDIRAARGKNTVGTIRVEARHSAGGIVIEVADDGAGLDESRIAERARSLGIDPGSLDRRQLFGLIFSAGFSTAQKVTDVSGRGVGLDVVRKNVELLRGTVDIDSSSGKGTTISIHLPLTLAVIEGFAVGVASDTYVIPMDAVVECAEAPRTDRHETSGVLQLHGEALPYVRLRHLFSIDAPVHARENVIVVRHPRGRAGIVVDALYGSIESIMKPIGRHLRHLPGIAGSSILGNGRVALILDIAEVFRHI